MRLKKPEACQGCVGWGWGHDGFVPADGTGKNGVLVVLEAAGEDESEAGVPTVGRAGLYLWSQLQRAGIEREGFRIHNVLSCRPPGNKLAKMAYEQDAIAKCAPNLDATITDMHSRCRENGRRLVIIALGRIAFKRLLDLPERSQILKEEYLCYPFWSERYEAWILAADHPSYIMRGNHHLAPVLQFTFKRALEIAEDGFKFEEPSYLLDPVPAHFKQWVDGYKAAWAVNPDNTFLSYDIETPYKSGKSEDTLESAADESYTILRISFAYREDSAVSVPWTALYTPMIAELFAHPGIKFGWNSDEYDAPRIMAQMPIDGTLIDAMVAWHVLNSAMPKGLGFVTPFYATGFQMWKHLSEREPALYNAIDALAALRCWLGIRRDLKTNGLWNVFERHVLKLNQVLTYMSQKGIHRDEAMRDEVEGKLQGWLKDVETAMEAVIPLEARKIDIVYKKTPKDTTGLYSRPGSREQAYCSSCGLPRPGKAHFKVYARKVNACAGSGLQLRTDAVVEWYRLREWAPSKDQLLLYQRVLGHQSVKDRDGKITFDVNALKRLRKKYPDDPLYALIGRQRYLQKLLGTYVGVRQEDGTIKGGMPMGKDGLGHPSFKHNPSTLRLSCPFFHTLPRPGKDPNQPHAWIRGMFIASPGGVFHARDFSGIEAVLVGYEARSARYIRLAKIDVHSYYTAYALYELDRRIPANDLPQLSWEDEHLKTVLAGIKAEFGQERNELYKHLTHAINFGQGPKGAQEKIYKETGILQPLPKIGKVMGTYKELFPEIPAWHNEVRLQADRDGFLRNAFNYVHRFSRVFAWEKENGQWVRKLGDDAEAVLAFKPQSNAAGIIKEAMLRLYFQRFEEAGQYLRLQVHDELLNDVPLEKQAQVDAVLQEEMERPIPEMPLPASYGMGPFLTILSEPKSGVRWGEMK